MLSSPEDHDQTPPFRPCPGSPLSGLKKLKKESLGTCLVIVLTVPRPLCFCFFLMVLTVTFFPFFQSMVHLQG